MNNIINIMSATGKFLLTAVLAGATALTAAAAGREIKGRVVDPEGNPIPGAIVNVAEQSRIVITDTDGYFSLKDVSYDDELNAKAIGYITVVEPVGDDITSDKVMVITMQPQTDIYSNMMAAPFTEMQAKYITAATSVVAGQELQRYPVTVLQNAFNSTLTGVQTYEASSEPGWAETKMYIRGVRTMNANARDPLVIVDDVERDMSFLDAFPIETVTVIKDAAATALYGMRGANGVILIRTKRGEAGKTNIQFTQEVGFQTLSNTVENQNSYNTALTRNRANYLDGRAPTYSPEQIEMYRRVSNGETLPGIDKYKYFDTNWFDELYRDTAPVVKTNLQISGGNNRARYYVSFSYLRQEGMWSEKGTSFNDRFNTQHVLNRWNLRTNLDINVNKYLKVGLDLGGRIDNIKQPTTGVFSLVTFGAIEADPMRPVYTPQGYLYYDSKAQNPTFLLGSSGQEKNRRRQLYSTLTVTGDLSPITKGLNIRGVISFDAYDVFQSTQTNRIATYSYDYNNADVTDVSQFKLSQTNQYSELTNPSTHERANSWTLNMRLGLGYNRVFGKHDVNVNAFIRTYQRRLNVREASVSNAQYSSDRFLSYNGTATYVFDRRYVLTGNVSHMGNDNYAPGDRWDTFWGVSAGWLANNESFLQSENIDLLKLRASYGRAGMNETGAGRYPYQSIYQADNGYSFGTNATWVPGYAEATAGVSNNKWEISKMLDLGLDFDFWHHRLYGSVDFFKEWRSNILVNRSNITDILGASFSQDSFGKAESRGVEFTLGTTQKFGDFTLNVEGLFSWNTNKITEMDEVAPAVEWQARTGHRIRDFATVSSIYEWENRTVIGGWNQYRFEQWASDPNLVATSHQDAIDHPEKYPYNSASGGKQALGTAVFRDINGDRIIDTRDKVPYGYTMIPEMTPSLSIYAAYKGFDLKVVGTAYLNRSVFVSPALTFSEWSSNATHEVTKAWGYYTDDPTDPRNINAKYPRISNSFNAIDSSRGANNNDTGSYMNDIWIMNGDYLSLRNIEFGYSLPQKLIAKAYMTRCRVYFNAYNVAEWSHLPKGMDPEKPMSFCWWYPKTRIFSFGLNIAF